MTTVNVSQRFDTDPSVRPKSTLQRPTKSHTLDYTALSAIASPFNERSHGHGMSVDLTFAVGVKQIPQAESPSSERNGSTDFPSVFKNAGLPTISKSSIVCMV